MKRKHIILIAFIATAAFSYFYFWEPHRDNDWLGGLSNGQSSVQPSERISPDRLRELSGKQRDEAIALLKTSRFLSVPNGQFATIPSCPTMYLVRGVRYENYGDPLEVYFRNGIVIVWHSLLTHDRPGTEKAPLVVCTPGPIHDAAAYIEIVE